MSLVNRLLQIIIIGVIYQLIETSDSEHHLVRYLFSEKDYNPLIRPTQYSNETVIVLFGLLLVQLIHVYEKEQIMKTNTWLHMKWYDSQLRWNPEQYGGINKINIPFSNVWTPDVVLFNNADGNYEVTFKSKVLIMHTGEVHWIPPAIYKSSCRIDVTYFPFDTQKCEMRFASWTYNSREVLFSHYEEDMDQSSELKRLLPQQVTSATSDQLYKDDYLESGTWEVLRIPSKFVHYRSNASSVLPDNIEVVFLIEMNRKSLYYTVNLVVPTGLMSILICIVFCLPTAAGEKMTLCMSILLALNLFQLLVTKILPPTSAVVPLIAKYLLFTFTLNILVIVNTVIVTNLYYRTPMTHSMPCWIRRVFLHTLPRLLWMQSLRSPENEFRCNILPIDNVHQMTPFLNSYDTSSETTSDDQVMAPSNYIKQGHRMDSTSNTSYLSYMNDKRRTSTILFKKSKLRSKSFYHRKNNQNIILNNNEQNHSVPAHLQHHHRIQINLLRQELIQALIHIRFISAHCAHQASIELIHNEWKYIATVVDRLLFIIFSIITTVASFALFLQVPDLFNLNAPDPQKLVRFANPNVTVHKLNRV